MVLGRYTRQAVQTHTKPRATPGLFEPLRPPTTQRAGGAVTEAGMMKALKATICVTALALSLSLVVPCYAGEADAAPPGIDEVGPHVLREAFASRLELQSKELYQAGKYAAA